MSSYITTYRESSGREWRIWLYNQQQQQQRGYAPVLETHHVLKWSHKVINVRNSDNKLTSWVLNIFNNFRVFTGKFPRLGRILSVAVAVDGKVRFFMLCRCSLCMLLYKRTSVRHFIFYHGISHIQWHKSYHLISLYIIL